MAQGEAAAASPASLPSSRHPRAQRLPLPAPDPGQELCPPSAPSFHPANCPVCSHRARGPENRGTEHSLRLTGAPFGSPLNSPSTLPSLSPTSLPGTCSETRPSLGRMSICRAQGGQGLTKVSPPPLPSISEVALPVHTLRRPKRIRQAQLNQRKAREPPATRHLTGLDGLKAGREGPSRHRQTPARLLQAAHPRMKEEACAAG